ncbi:hypothetical protein TNCV_2860041 [Trichonephila clavipes]|nr:hypothetical protein TNCV_2860041 [Trichonephila clavipes]
MIQMDCLFIPLRWKRSLLTPRISLQVPARSVVWKFGEWGVRSSVTFFICLITSVLNSPTNTIAYTCTGKKLNEVKVCCAPPLASSARPGPGLRTLSKNPTPARDRQLNPAWCSSPVNNRGCNFSPCMNSTPSNTNAASVIVQSKKDRVPGLGRRPEIKESTIVSHSKRHRFKMESMADLEGVKRLNSQCVCTNLFQFRADGHSTHALKIYSPGDEGWAGR